MRFSSPGYARIDRDVAGPPSRADSRAPPSGRLLRQRVSSVDPDGKGGCLHRFPGQRLEEWQCWNARRTEAAMAMRPSQARYTPLVAMPIQRNEYVSVVDADLLAKCRCSMPRRSLTGIYGLATRRGRHNVSGPGTSIRRAQLALAFGIGAMVTGSDRISVMAAGLACRGSRGKAATKTEEPSIRLNSGRKSGGWKRNQTSAEFRSFHPIIVGFVMWRVAPPERLAHLCRWCAFRTSISVAM